MCVFFSHSSVRLFVLHFVAAANRTVNCSVNSFVHECISVNLHTTNTNSPLSCKKWCVNLIFIISIRNLNDMCVCVSLDDLSPRILFFFSFNFPVFVSVLLTMSLFSGTRVSRMWFASLQSIFVGSNTCVPLALFFCRCFSVFVCLHRLCVCKNDGHRHQKRQQNIFSLHRKWYKNDKNQ